MFEKSLQDMVKGIRNAGNDATAYTAKCIQEIKEELKSKDVTIKAQALQKLIYLNMLGHDMAFASFSIIEVMSQERFGLKRIGLLAAGQSFTPSTDVLVLCTALLAKQFKAHSPFEIGVAINTLANIATEDLARDLLSDVVAMLTSSRPYIRKKATLVLYKLYFRYPQGLRLTFDHLKRRLTDDSIGVQCAAVNVICELARRKPENYLELAPDLFNLLTASTHTWMTIKVVKLLASLVVVEPRLARKLLEPLANIVQGTQAKSLQYEAMNALTVALQHTKKADGTDAKNVPTVVRLITDRLREFVREPDQNLKYLGLTGLVNLMKSHPRVVAEHRELVLQCLLDEDVTIRLRALELIAGMVTRRNLPDIVGSLVGHLETAEGHYRDELIEKIITMCSRDKYAYLEDFGWYIGVLAKLAYLPGIARHGGTIAGQMIDVAVRVEDARPSAVQALLPMLADTVLFQNARASSKEGPAAAAAAAAAAVPEPGAAPVSEAAANAVLSGTTGTGASQVLYAAAWIVGEFCSIIPARLHSNVLDALLQPSVLLLPAGVQSAYVQCALKTLSCAAAAALKAGETGASAPFLTLAASVLSRLNPFAQSIHVEVQERACLVQQLLATLGVPFTPLPAKVSEAKPKEEDPSAQGSEGAAKASSPVKTPLGAGAPPLEADVRLISGVLASLFSEALRPVNPKAQKKVPLPEGLNLDAWINPEEAADPEERSGRSALMYSSVSFEDSYGVKDDEFAGTEKKGKGRRGESDAGPKMYDIGTGADEDDDAWFDDMAKKNKKRDKELWGGDEEKGGKKGKGRGKGKKGKAASDSEEEKPARRRGGGDDPYKLKSKGGRAGSEDIDVDSIPIKKLGAEDLKPVNALAMDINIFGDFGKKDKKDKKEKKSKKGKGGGGSDEDAPAAASSKTRRIIDDDDLPPGASADADKDSDEDIADALAAVDLRTPLGADEHLPERKHRAVGDPAALRSVGVKGKGRARVLGGGEPSAAEPEEEAGGKKDKKEKKEKKEKKDSKEEEKPSKSKSSSSKKEKEEEKPSKSSSKSKEGKSKHKEEEEEEKPKKKKSSKDEEEEEKPKKKKSSKDEEEEKPKKEKKEKKVAEEEAAPAPAPAPVPAPAPAPAPVAKAAEPAKPTQGDAVAAGEPFEYVLLKDKVVRVVFTISADVAAGPAVVTMRVEPRSSKKAVDYVDITLPEGCPLSAGPAGVPAGGAPGSLRIAAGVKPKDKAAPKAGKSSVLSLAITPAIQFAGLSFPVKVTYKVAEGKKEETAEAVMQIRASALLMPTVMEADAYRTLMTTEGAKFEGAAGVCPLLGGNGEDTIATAVAIFRAYAVARSPKHAILYSRTPGPEGVHVTALVKVDDATGVLQVQMKSMQAGHGAVLLADVQQALAAVAAESKAKEEE